MKQLFIAFIAFLLLGATVKAQSNKRTNTSSQKVNPKPATNAVDSHDKYANQEVNYATGNNKTKTKTNTKPAPSSKTSKTKLMEEEGIYYRRRH